MCDAQSMKPAEMLTYAHDPQPPPQNYILPLPNLLTVIAVTSGQRDGVSECVWQCACGSVVVAITFECVSLFQYTLFYRFACAGASFE